MKARSILVHPVLLASAFGVGVLAGACTSREGNPDHCSNNEGDRYCAELSPDRPLCSSGNDGRCNAGFPTGCVAAEDLVDGCADPCGTLSAEECEGVSESSSGSGSDGSGETGGSTTEAGTSTTTGPVECMGPADCTDPSAPFCSEDGTCLPCGDAPNPIVGDATCANADPLAPLCVGGACVACTAEDTEVCDMQNLLCDAETNACVPCTEHEQCEVGACELAVGRCFPNDAVRVTVDGDDPENPTTLAGALAQIDSMGGIGVIELHALDGETPYLTGGLEIGSGMVAIIPNQEERPILQGSGGNPGLRISGSETVVYLDGLDVVGNTTGAGLVVDQAFAWVDRGQITQNSGGGVQASNGAELTLRNCFVGGGTPDVDALAADSSMLTITFSTLGGGTVLAGRARALACVGGTANVRNSILVSGDSMPEVECDNLSISNSATESEIMFVPSSFSGYASGDFHLTEAGDTAYANIAQWQVGDPVTDIDGDPRPTVDGSPDHAGADVP